MNRYDWQAYLDGSLTDSERTRADNALAADPEAQHQLEDCISFVSEIKRQGLSEEIPFAKLEAMIPKRRSVSMFSLRWLTAASVVAVLAAFWFDSSRPKFEPYETVAVASISQAARWIEERNGIQFAKLPEGIGEIVASERTADSGCFCLKINGRLVHLGVTKNQTLINGMETVSRGGKEYYSGKGKVAFLVGKQLWITEGDSNELVWRVAEQASTRMRV